MKVLIAEDDPISALALETLLCQQGYDVTVTTDGAKAWEALQRDYFPLVVLDSMMPEINGVELCRKIRGRKTDVYICIIMLTAKQERTDRLQALNAGADVFLNKPLDCEEMVARLRIARRILEMER